MTWHVKRVAKYGHIHSMLHIILILINNVHTQLSHYPNREIWFPVTLKCLTTCYSVLHNVCIEPFNLFMIMIIKILPLHCLWQVNNTFTTYLQN